MKNRNIAIITGGDSLESLSSVRSADNLYRQLDGSEFNRYLLSLGDWRWRLLAGDGICDADLPSAQFDLGDFSIHLRDRQICFDGVFIAIHGAPAETGHIQGYLEMVGMPYTGSGILASSLAMDKRACKHFLSHLSSVQFSPDIIFDDVSEAVAEQVEKLLGYPCVVKPNSYGSGIGVAVVANRPALLASAQRIAVLGQEILAEKFVPGREFTVGAFVIGKQFTTLPIAEIFRPDHQQALRETGQAEFTDRQSADIQINPSLDEETARRFAEITIAIGKAVKCRSFYRVDYILADDGGIHFLEINTIPGMTPKSVFTQQIQASAYSEQEIYRQIILDMLPEKTV